MSTTPLPAKASLSQLRTRAKDLRKAVLKARPDAIERVQAHHPGYSGGFEPTAFTLRDAQLTIAREHGLPSWAAGEGDREVLARELQVEPWFGLTC